MSERDKKNFKEERQPLTKGVDRDRVNESEENRLSNQADSAQVDQELAR